MSHRGSEPFFKSRKTLNGQDALHGYICWALKLCHFRFLFISSSINKSRGKPEKQQPFPQLDARLVWAQNAAQDVIRVAQNADGVVSKIILQRQDTTESRMWASVKGHLSKGQPACTHKHAHIHSLEFPFPHPNILSTKVVPALMVGGGGGGGGENATSACFIFALVTQEAKKKRHLASYKFPLDALTMTPHWHGHSRDQVPKQPSGTSKISLHHFFSLRQNALLNCSERWLRESSLCGTRAPLFNFSITQQLHTARRSHCVITVITVYYC